MRLAARWRAGLGPPGGDRRLREPDRETASLTQAGVVLGPIRHPMPLLRNAVTASGIGFEWHGRNRWSGAEEASTLTQPRLPIRSSMQQSGSFVNVLLKLTFR